MRTFTAVMLTILAACSTPSSTGDRHAGGSRVPVGSGVVPRPAHVLMVIFENRDAGAVFGSPFAPYLNSLARTGAKLTDSHGVAHPSQPNYIALLSGSTQG